MANLNATTWWNFGENLSGYVFTIGGWVHVLRYTGRKAADCVRGRQTQEVHYYRLYPLLLP